MIRPSPLGTDACMANAYALTELDHVRALVGHATLGTGDPDSAASRLGEITLMPHQREAIARLRIAIERFGGALLADDVGLGKTFVALGVAREYARAWVLAPASLVPMWRTAILRAGVPHVAVRSLHGFSQIRSSAREKLECDHIGQRELVIVDEAHYLRNGTTIRYREVSRFVAGCDVLLLSATPLHNTSSDLRCILGLFAGSRRDLLEPALLAQLVVRRGDAPASADARPDVCEHAPLPVPFDTGTLSALLALPAPLPAHDGAVAGALIRLGLLRAWCSSDAALTAALERRLLRGGALRHALESGRHPTNEELRTWLVGEQEVQLAFPELMASQVVASGPLLEVLSRHLRAVADLLAHHARTAKGDIARVRALRDVLESHGSTRVLAFSQFAGTVRALHRALADIAGVGALSSERGRIASGVVPRADLLARFAPVAQGVPPPPPHQAIRLLIATDVLSEGVNLQDAGVLVHLDLPWTDALLRQRVGRVVRIGALHQRVHVYRFAIPSDVERAIRLLERVHEKAQAAAQFVGKSHGAASRATSPHSAADLASHVQSCLARWRALPLLPRPGTRDPGIPLIAFAGPAAPDACGLALVRIGTEHRLLACRAHRSVHSEDCVVCDDTMSIARTIDAIDQHESAPVARGGKDDVTARVTSIRAAIGDWLATRALRRDSGAQPTELSAAHRRVARQVQAVLASLPSTQRAPLARLADDVSDMLASSQGADVERSLEAWYATRADRSPVDWLSGWTSFPSLRPGRGVAFGRRLSEDEDVQESDACVEAIILLSALPGLRR